MEEQNVAKYKGRLFMAYKISDHAENICTLAYLSLVSVLNKTKFNMADTWFQC